MQTYGTFVKFIQRNAKTGRSVFLLHTKDGNITVNGYTVSYKKNAPLLCELSERQSNGIFSLLKSTYCGADREDTIKYLSSRRTFPLMTKVFAKKILRNVGNVFGQPVQMEDYISKLYKEEKTDERDTILSCINKVQNDAYFEGLYREILCLGGTYEMAMNVFNDKQRRSLESIYGNPYFLVPYGLSFKECDRKAAKLNIPIYDKRRVRALVQSVVEQDMLCGNTCMTFDRLCDGAQRLDKAAQRQEETSPLFIAQELIERGYKITEKDGQVIIAPKHIQSAERTLAINIARIIRSSHKITDNINVEDAEAKCNIKYSDSQSMAFEALETSGLKVITGGPGTGKTTLLNGLLKEYMDKTGKDRGSIALCAPTGCAAMRLSEATGMKASTIHRLLGLRPYMEEEPSVDPIDASLVVVDEASMLGTELAGRLFSAIKSGALVILIGDKDQLPSIEPGNVFQDIISSGKADVYTLDTIFRQTGRNMVITNSRRILEGKPLYTNNSFKVISVPSINDASIAFNEIERFLTKDEDFMLYTPVRNSKFKYGSIALNNKLQTLYRKQDNKQGRTSFHYGEYTFREGDKVVFTRNNYKKGYVNGQNGVITNIQLSFEDTDTQIEILSNGDTYLLDHAEELEDIELAYALTAHKAQGGETDHAIIILPKAPSSMLRKDLLYVEVTRARKTVTIITEDGALPELLKKPTPKRDTMLCYFINTYCQRTDKVLDSC